jgi:hypothetical protein
LALAEPLFRSVQPCLSVVEARPQMTTTQAGLFA